MLPAIDSVGIDIWTMDKGIMFDNIVVDSSPEEVMAFGQATFKVRSEIEAKQDKAATGDSIFSQAVDWVLANPIPVLVTVVALLAGSFLLCCRGGSAPPRPTAAAGEGTPQRKKLSEYKKARSDSPSRKKDDDAQADDHDKKGESAPTEATEKKEEGGLSAALAQDD
mmetsp:Transcript_6706/g.12174  ORF Transcript_6706/g.12174 Transcript_6706/m.12174 type:complete len:167 (+) Transcript_6706:138-638(+)